jgi:hypothetical protein
MKVSKLSVVALNQVLSDNQRRFMEVAQAAAENDEVDLAAGWRLDVEKLEWVAPPSNGKPKLEE